MTACKEAGMVRICCVLALACALVATARAGGAKFGELTVEEVAKKLPDKNVYVFDCNPHEEYVDGHLPRAKWVEFSHLQAGSLPADKKATLIFYCQNEH